MKRRREVLLITLALMTALSGLAGCRYAPDPDLEEPPPGHHWSYDGETSPAHWAEIDEAYHLCADGDQQSPIDLSRDLAMLSQRDIVFDYHPSPLSIWNNGHTVQVVYEPGSTMTIDGAVYELMQFHFHAHSEHTLDGEHFPMELHLVHQGAEGQLAVVGVMIVEGEANDQIETIFADLPEEFTEEPLLLPEDIVDASQLLPASHSGFEYSGSLTTPPCTEGVRWFVMAEPIEITPSQLAEFTDIYDHNYRPLQPLNEREVQFAEESESEQ